MKRLEYSDVWEAYVDAHKIVDNTKYKYKLICDGCSFMETDPFANRCEPSPETASLICDLDSYKWRDKGWLEYRAQSVDCKEKPLNVYELDPRYWKSHEDGRCFSYSEVASDLSTYVKQMGYTHILLNSVIDTYRPEYFLFAPSAKQGTPKEFMSFVDSMHEAGIGVILEWYPKVFLEDERRVFDRDFDWGSFARTNANFWIDKYHIDGLSISLDNHFVSCREIICEIVEGVSCSIKERTPEIILISNTDDGLSHSCDFIYNKTTAVDYFKTMFEQVDVTATNTLNLISSVNGKGDNSLTVLESERLNMNKVVLGALMAHDARHISFMGSEIGWSSDALSFVEWGYLDRESNARYQYFVSDLNEMYLENSDLFMFGKKTFCSESGIYTVNIELHNEKMIVIINPTSKASNCFGFPKGSSDKYIEVLNSDNKNYVGRGQINISLDLNAEVINSICVPPFSVVFLKKQ